MTKNNQTKKYTWDVQKLRFTFFPKSPQKSISGDELWDLLTGYELEKKEDNPKTGERIWIGIKDDFRLILKTHPVRVDLILQPKEPFIVSDTEINMLGEFEESLDVFQKIASQFLSKKDTLPQIIRLAFGALLFKTVKGRNQGYEMLSQCLPFSINSENTYDFNLQINKPTSSKVLKKLRINRLTKWSVLNTKVEMFSNAGPDTLVRLPESWLNHLELDINTDKENKEPFRNKSLTKLFKELVTEGIKISKEGLPK